MPVAASPGGGTVTFFSACVEPRIRLAYSRIARLHDGKWLGGSLSQDIAAIADDGAGGLWLAARPGGLVRLALEPGP